MRAFEQIVTDAGSDDEIAAALGVKRHQPRDWRLRKRIPSEHWRKFQALGWASLEELAAAAERVAA